MQNYSYSVFSLVALVLHLMEHVDLFGFVGQFAVVSDDARDAVKAARGPEMRRELTYGGVGLSVGF